MATKLSSTMALLKNKQGKTTPIADPDDAPENVQSIAENPFGLNYGQITKLKLEKLDDLYKSHAGLFPEQDPKSWAALSKQAKVAEFYKALPDDAKPQATMETVQVDDEGNTVDEGDSAQITKAAVETVKTLKSGKSVKVKEKVEHGAISDMSHAIENIESEAVAINLVKEAIETHNSDNFRIGGMLSVILNNAWFAGHGSFKDFLKNEDIGIVERKARYLVSIYVALTAAYIEWEKVKNVGWSKLKELIRLPLTEENVDEWVAKALSMNTIDLIAAVDAYIKNKAGLTDPEKVESNQTSVSFKLFKDQLEVLEMALGTAEAKTGSQVKAVQLEMICSEFVSGGKTAVTKTVSIDEASLPLALKAVFKQLGDMDPMKAIIALTERFAEAFPDFDMEVNQKDHSGE